MPRTLTDRRWERSAPTNCAKSAMATTAPGSRIPPSGGARCLRGDGRPQPAGQIPAEFPAATKCSSFTLAIGPKWRPRDIRVGVQYLASLARRERRGAALQSRWKTPRPPKSAARNCGSGCGSKRHVERPDLHPRLFDRLFDTEVHILADVPNIEEAAALFRQMVTAESSRNSSPSPPTNCSTELSRFPTQIGHSRDNKGAPGSLRTPSFSR